MFNFSIKKYSGLLAIVGTLLTGNVWAGCDIDFAYNKNADPGVLKVRFDTRTGECAKSKWTKVYFYFTDLHNHKERVEVTVKNPRRNDRVVKFPRVNRAQTANVKMYLQDNSGNRKYIDKARKSLSK